MFVVIIQSFRIIVSEAVCVILVIQVVGKIVRIAGAAIIDVVAFVAVVVVELALQTDSRLRFRRTWRDCSGGVRTGAARTHGFAPATTALSAAHSILAIL